MKRVFIDMDDVLANFPIPMTIESCSAVRLAAAVGAG